jgi:hypothetical protein
MFELLHDRAADVAWTQNTLVCDCSCTSKWIKQARRRYERSSPDGVDGNWIADRFLGYGVH